LNTEYHYFQHKKSGGYRIACDEYGLPQHVREHVDFVMPTIQLDGLEPVAHARATIQAPVNITGLSGTINCATLITIDCLRAIYNIPIGKYNHSGNQLGIAEWADYLYLPDLKTFFQNFTSPKIPSDVVPEFISIDGGKPSNLSVALASEVIESALDFQTAYSIIWPQQTRLYQSGDSVNVDSVGTFNIFLDALVSQSVLPHSHPFTKSARMAHIALTKEEISHMLIQHIRIRMRAGTLDHCNAAEHQSAT
jgi:tripeptidyl-peptidase-1